MTYKGPEKPWWDARAQQNAGAPLEEIARHYKPNKTVVDLRATITQIDRQLSSLHSNEAPSYSILEETVTDYNHKLAPVSVNSRTNKLWNRINNIIDQGLDYVVNVAGKLVPAPARKPIVLTAYTIIVAAIITGCSSQSELAAVPIKSYEIRSDGALRIIDNIYSAQNGAFSPDSRKIVFTHFKSGYNEGEADLKILDLETSKLAILISDGNSNINLPGSSWIGDEIIFSSTKDPHDEIYVIDAISKRIKQITSREDLVAYEPSFSPDKEKVVFESHKLDVEEYGVITIYNIKEGTYIEITNKNGDSRQPNWSPKGDLILYQKLINDQWDIWIYNLSSRKEFKLTSGEGDKTDASFSADGEWIVYSSNEGGEEFANIYIQSIDGKKIKKITNFKGYDGAPSWSYDNKYIVFESTVGEPDDSKGSNLWIIPFEK